MSYTTQRGARLMKAPHSIIWLLLTVLATANAMAQTNPTPQNIPYTQDFSALAHNSTTLPAGWQGWRIGAAASTSYQVVPATADLPLIASSTAATTTGGIHNYAGKIGFLNSGTVNAAVVLALNTRARTNIEVAFELMTIRNPYSAFPPNLGFSEAVMQYRIGTSGNFTTLPDTEYQSNSTNQTAPVTTPQNSQSYSITLPAACEDQPVVQLRWVARDVIAASSRPSFAVDNISVTGTCIPASAEISYAGSPYCSDVGIADPTLIGTSGGVYTASGMTIDAATGTITLNGSSSGNVTYTIVAENGCTGAEATADVVISQAASADAGGAYTSVEAATTAISAIANGPGSWSGGQGTFADAGTPSTTYTPIPAELGYTVVLTWTTDDPDGAGPCSAASDDALMHVDFLVYTPMFSGGIGRGDASTAYEAPPITADIYNGGIGRGDAADLYVSAPVASSIFSGGNGRGDVADLFVSAPVASSIFSGGNGRGDVADLFVSAPIASNIFSGGNGRGDVADLFVSAPIASSIFNGGNGRGDVADLFVSEPIASSIYFGGNGRGDVADLFVSPPIASSIFAGGIGRGDVSSLYTVPLNLQLAVKAYLEGPYDAGLNRMKDDLRSIGLLPTAEPYTALGYTFVGGGGETANASVFNSGGGSNRIVDWVIVELRDADDPGTIVSSRCALIQRDGDVVGLDGTSAVEMAAGSGNYFVAIRHRNHLGVMTAAHMALSETPVSVDFTQAVFATYGTDARKAAGSSMVLWAGDVSFDGILKYAGQSNDRDPILTAIGGIVPTNTINGYRGEDVNMDGVVKYAGQANDRDPILQNIGGVVPTAVRSEQIP